MANGYYCTSRTGGATGSLDGITGYANGSVAIVLEDDIFWFYKYDSSKAAASDDDPNVIVPDDNATGTGAWVLQKGIGEKVNNIGDFGGGAQTIDLNLGRAVTATVSTGAVTFTFSNPLSSGYEDGFTLYLTNGGSQTITWPASVDWENGNAPAMTAAGLDILVFMTKDGGTTWYGFMAAKDSK